MNLVKEAAAELGKATPPAGWLAAKSQGITFSLDDLATVMAVVLLTLQIGFLLWEKVGKKLWQKRHGRK